MGESAGNQMNKVKKNLNAEVRRLGELRRTGENPQKNDKSAKGDSISVHNHGEIVTHFTTSSRINLHLEIALPFLNCCNIKKTLISEKEVL